MILVEDISSTPPPYHQSDTIYTLADLLHLAYQFNSIYLRATSLANHSYNA